MEIPDHLTCFLRNLYAGQEAIVTTGQELAPNWERGMSRLHIVTLLIYLIYKIHHVKCWAGWSTSRNQDCWENINNLRHADDTSQMAEREKWKWKWSHLVMSTLCDPVDCSLSSSSIHGIFQARLLERIAISFSRESSWPRDWTRVSRIVGRRFTVWTTREAHYIYTHSYIFLLYVLSIPLILLEMCHMA